MEKMMKTFVKVCLFLVFAASLIAACSEMAPSTPTVVQPTPVPTLTGPEVTPLMGIVKMTQEGVVVKIHQGETLYDLFDIKMRSEDIEIYTQSGPMCGDEPHWGWEWASLNGNQDQKEVSFGIYAEKDAPIGTCHWSGDIILRDMSFETQPTETHHVEFDVETVAAYGFLDFEQSEIYGGPGDVFGDFVHISAVSPEVNSFAFVDGGKICPTENGSLAGTVGVTGGLSMESGYITGIAIQYNAERGAMCEGSLKVELRDKNGNVLQVLEKHIYVVVAKE